MNEYRIPVPDEMTTTVVRLFDQDMPEDAVVVLDEETAAVLLELCGVAVQ